MCVIGALKETFIFLQFSFSHYNLVIFLPNKKSTLEHVCVKLIYHSMHQCGLKWLLFPYSFKWPLLKTLFVQKLDQVMEEFNNDNPCERANPFPNVENAKYEDMKKRILEAMHRFTRYRWSLQWLPINVSTERLK